MDTRSRSTTPSRRYGDILGSIFSNGSGELEEKISSVSQVKRMFRERRQKNSPGGSHDRNSRPEQRQRHSSPMRQDNDVRSSNRPPKPDKNNRKSPYPDRRNNQLQNKNSTVGDSSAKLLNKNGTPIVLQLEPFQNEQKGVLTRLYGSSPIKRRDQLFDPSGSMEETLTKRVAKQVSKERGGTIEWEQKAVEAISPELSERKLESLQKYQALQMKKEMKHETIEASTIDLDERQTAVYHRMLTADQLTSKKEPEPGATLSSCHADLKQVRDIIEDQQIWFKKGIKHEMIKADKVECAERQPIDHPNVLKAEHLTSKIKLDPGITVSNCQEDLEKMRDIIKAQSQQIRFHETCLEKQSNYIDQLTLELNLNKKKKSKLALELETHDLKYSLYDDYRRMMDRCRLDSTCDKDEVDGESESLIIFNTYDVFSKIDYLSQLYYKSLLEVENRFSILQEEYNRILSTRCLKTEQHPGDIGNTVPNTEPTAALKSLENWIKLLESEKSRYHFNIKRKEKELENVKSEQNDSVFNRNTDFSNIDNLEKQTLKNKVVALETEIGFTSGKIDDKTRTRRYRALEKNLNDYVAEIMCLEDKLKTKKNIISKLKERNLSLTFRLEEQQRLDYRLPASCSSEMCEQSNNGQKLTTISSISTIDMIMSEDQLHYSDSSSQLYFIKPNSNSKEGTAVTESSLGLRSCQKNITKTGSTKSIYRSGSSSTSSARIAKLRKRLDALASDHSSVCTEDTQFSSKTSP